MKNTLRYKTRYDKNPFLDTDLEIQLNTNSHEKQKLIALKTVNDEHIVARHQIVDNEKFIKIFTNSVTNWLDLSKKAQAVLKYVLRYLPKQKHIITISINDLSNETGYSSLGPLYDGLNELVSLKLLARTTREDQYFINPKYLFNGDRMVLAEIIEKESIEKKPRKLNELPAGFSKDDLVD